ncbi:hypothetical protein AB6A40_011452 [Gnathostoma spinigerum]|uniref:C2H2-type domain-containing protein n=1 Tax=Gnathostoma spinigerum TaxID=75299 RepID=A0ABD6EXP2_9BILA
MCLSVSCTVYYSCTSHSVSTSTSSTALSQISSSSSSNLMPLSCMVTDVPLMNDVVTGSNDDHSASVSPSLSSAVNTDGTVVNSVLRSSSLPSTTNTCEDCNRSLCSASNLKRHRATCKAANARSTFGSIFGFFRLLLSALKNTHHPGI